MFRAIIKPTKHLTAKSPSASTFALAYRPDFAPLGFARSTRHPISSSMSSKLEVSSRPKDSTTHGQYHNASMKNVTECTSHWDDPESMERNQAEYKRFLEHNRRALKKSLDNDQHSDGPESTRKKRGRASSVKTSNKKHKSNEGTQEAPTAPCGSMTRVPKEGQQVTWHALPGWVRGEVVEVLYAEKEVDGKKVKASKEDPRVVLRSESSGKSCVHKPAAVYFD